jgi:hypothetical protein
MRVSKWIMPIVAVVVLFGSYAVTNATSLWVSSGRVLLDHGDRISPADIKGWMTLGEVADGLGLPLETVVTLAGVPVGTTVSGTTALNALEASAPGFDVETLRDRAQAYLDQPAGVTPPSATNGPTALPTPGITPTSSETSASHTASGSGSASSGITGQMTLAQVAAQAGVPLPELISAAGLPADVAIDAPLRDVRDRVPGFEVASVRAAVDALRQ